MFDSLIFVVLSSPWSQDISIVRMLFEVGGSVKDTQCGFKLFKANAAWPN